MSDGTKFVILIIVAIVCFGIGRGSDSEQYDRGYKAGYSKGYDEGYDEGYDKATGAFVKDTWVPTLGGAIIAIIFLFTSIILFILLKDRGKKIIESYKENLQRRKLLKLIDTNDVDIPDNASLSKLKELQEDVAEMRKGELEGQSKAEKVDMEGQYEMAKLSVLPELDNIDDRLTEIKFNLGMAKILDMKEYLIRQIERISSQEQLSDSQKTELYKNIRNNINLT